MLLAENALLRQQLLILRRQAKRPRCTQADRALLVLLASRLRTWRQALLVVQPETVLRWHRRLKAILHRIAVTQLRDDPAAQAYVARRVSEGKTRREALRALKRFIARAV